MGGESKSFKINFRYQSDEKVLSSHRKQIKEKRLVNRKLIKYSSSIERCSFNHGIKLNILENIRSEVL